MLAYFDGWKFWISRFSRLVALDSATYAIGESYHRYLQKREYLPCPFSKIWPRSTLTRGKVWPWDLCIDKAQARINGTWSRWASMLPMNPSTEKATGAQRSSRPFVKRTNGHCCFRENSLLFRGRKLKAGGDSRSKCWALGVWRGPSPWSGIGVAIAISRSKASRCVKNSIIFPTLPLTRTPCWMFFEQNQQKRSLASEETDLLE